MEKFTQQIMAVFKNSSTISQDQAQHLVNEVLAQSWIQKLLVFNDHSVFILDVKTMKYLYVSASIQNILGYEASFFTGVDSLVNILHPEDLQIIPEIASLAHAAIHDPSYTPEEQYSLRFTRNYRATHKKGGPVNVLVHSFGLSFDAAGQIQLELMIAADITPFNNSPHHFYRVSRRRRDGTEEVLLHGVYEQVHAHFTAREQQVFECLIKGITSPEIAKQLGISEETVKTHRKNILEKAGADNSIQLLRLGYANGWC